MSVSGQTEEECGADEMGAPERDLYDQKAVSKVVRVLTVLAYLLSVSLAAILLSVYYVCVWKSPELPLLNDTLEGVECTTAPTITKALQEKKPVMIQVTPSIADSIGKIIASANAYHIIRGYLDKIILVDEVWISRAMINIMEREKLVVEGAGACPVAAIMAGKVPELRGKNVVCILSGGNINSTRMSFVIDRGMAAEGRLVRFSAALPDVPGAMAKLLNKVTDSGADVKSFVPERAWMRRDAFTININMLIETSDVNHARELENKLVKDYPRSQFTML